MLGLTGCRQPSRRGRAPQEAARTRGHHRRRRHSRRRRSPCPETNTSVHSCITSKRQLVRAPVREDEVYLAFECMTATATAPGPQSYHGCRMSPEPDYGYKSYKGSGKLTDKVSSCLVMQLKSNTGNA
jgi:hypothetical protein